MAFSIVVSGGGASTDGNNATVTLDTRTATFIVVGIVGNATFSQDQGGNAYTGRTAQTGQTPYTRLYDCENPNTAASHTFTASGGAPCIFVIALTGQAASAFYTQNGASGVSNTLQTGNVSPNVDDQLIVTVMGNQDNTTNAISPTGPGFTIITPQFQTVAFQHFAGAMAYEIQTAKADRNPTWSWTNGASSTAAIATYNAAAAGGVTTRFLSLLGVGK